MNKKDLSLWLVQYSSVVAHTVVWLILVVLGGAFAVSYWYCVDRRSLVTTVTKHQQEPQEIFDIHAGP